MSEPRRRDPRIIALVVVLVAASVLGLGLAFFGVGAELSEERTVVMNVRVIRLNRDVSSQIKVGDTVYVDPGGMAIGVITAAEVRPFVRAVPDSEGDLQGSEDPLEDEATITIEAVGREGDGLIAISNQVVQAGQSFNVVTRDLFLRSTILSIEVR